MLSIIEEYNLHLKTFQFQKLGLNHRRKYHYMMIVTSLNKFVAFLSTNVFGAPMYKAISVGRGRQKHTNLGTV